MRSRSSDHIRLTFAMLFLAFVTGGQIGDREFRDILSKTIDLTPEEFASLDEGNVVVKSLPTDNKQEVATLAILRITKGLPAVSMTVFRESLSQKNNDALKGGGKFSDPPAIDDLQSLELDDDAFEQLRECEVERCDLHFTASMIKRYRNEVDWNAPEHRAVATRLFREMLIERLRGYAAAGDAGLGFHENRRKHIDLSASHRWLLAESAVIPDLAPEFTEYLRTFPRGDLPGVESSFYWSVVDFGLKPSVTLSHSVAYSKPSPDGEQHFVASKQIYASRYVDASLTFSMLLRAADAGVVKTYMIIADRSRSDALEGPFGGLARRLVRKEAEERMKELLTKAELRLLAATSPPRQTDSDEPGFLDRAMRQMRRPIILALVGLIFVGAVFWYVLRRAK